MNPLIPAICLLAVLGAAGSFARIVRCGGRPRSARSGSTTLEFTLAFPAFLVSVFTAAQTALLMHAQVVVDYAAFTAARSASVWIGPMAASEHFDRSSGVDEARARVLRAATLTCVAISPGVRQLVSFGMSATPVGLGAALRDGALSVAPAASSVTELALDVVERWPYASAYTGITLQAHGDAACGGTDPRVTVTVEHRYRMPVPFAGPLLARMLGGGRLGIPGEYYAPLKAGYTMRRWACDHEI
jgi:hypothetical protein